MQSGKIKNRAITASSSFNNFHSAWLSRLHRIKRGRYIGAWASKYRNYNQWLQVDLGYASKITGIATQGRQDAIQWVTVYRVYYSTDGVYFALVKYWWNAVKVTGVNLKVLYETRAGVFHQHQKVCEAKSHNPIMALGEAQFVRTF